MDFQSLFSTSVLVMAMYVAAVPMLIFGYQRRQDDKNGQLTSTTSYNAIIISGWILFSISLYILFLPVSYMILQNFTDLKILKNDVF